MIHLYPRQRAGRLDIVNVAPAAVQSLSKRHEPEDTPMPTRYPIVKTRAARVYEFEKNILPETLMEFSKPRKILTL